MLKLDEQLLILKAADAYANAAVRAAKLAEKAKRLGEPVNKAHLARQKARERLIEVLKEAG